jgi:hypothetical protein
MDEIIFGEILKRISLFGIIVGLLTGLDLLTGARVISIFNKVSNKRFLLDDAINNPKARVGLGIIFLAVCGLLVFLVLTAG